MDYCINCGADLTDEMERCPECGAARLGRRPAPFTPTFPSAYKEAPTKESEPVLTESMYVPQEPQEEILRDQPAPVDSGHAPGEPVIMDQDLTDVSDLEEVIASVTEKRNNPSSTQADDAVTAPEYEEVEYEEYYNDPAYDVLSTPQYMGTILLMNIPVIGWLATLIWALGGTRNFNRRNMARAQLFLSLIVTALLAVVGFVISYFWPDLFTMITDKILAVIDVFQ